MANGPVSRQELIRRRRSGGFVGRRRELAAFRENLVQGTGADTYQFLFHVHGLAGVGKSTLIRRWEATAREEGAVTAVVGDDVHSAVEAMAAISEQLARQNCPLKQFDKQLSTYRQKCHEADAAFTEQLMCEGGRGPGPSYRAEPSPSSTFAAQIGVAGLGLVSGIGALSGAVRPEHVASGLDRARTALSSRLRSHEDVQFLLSPLKVLTPQFLADLRDVAGRRPWVVLFFDTYERTAPLLDVWLRDMLVGEAYGAVPVNVQAALAGQGPLNPACWGDSLDLVTEVALEPFSEDEARALLAARGVSDARVVDVVLGRYEKALADFDRAIELLPSCGWFPYQRALTMRLSGEPGEADHWQRAVDIYQAEVRSWPDFADLARSNLLVLCCAMPDWDRAEEQLRAFLSYAPSPHQIVEALDDLADLQRTVPVSPERLAPVLAQLRDALGAP
ncbi:AAA family ATPase [Streptomyces sp. NPDC002853]